MTDRPKVPVSAPRVPYVMPEKPKPKPRKKKRTNKGYVRSEEPPPTPPKPKPMPAPARVPHRKPPLRPRLPPNMMSPYRRVARPTYRPNKVVTQKVSPVVVQPAQQAPPTVAQKVPPAVNQQVRQVQQAQPTVHQAVIQTVQPAQQAVIQKVPPKHSKRKPTPPADKPQKRRQLEKPPTQERFVDLLRDRYVGNKSIIHEISEFIKVRTANPVPLPKQNVALVIQGPSGIGKMTAIRHCCRVEKRVLIEVSASDFYPKSKQQPLTFEEQLYSIINSKNVLTGAVPVVVLHGFDGWESSMIRSTICVLKKIKGIKERKKKQSDSKKPKKPLRGIYMSTKELLHLRAMNNQCNPLLITVSDTYFKERKLLQQVAKITRLYQPKPADMVKILTQLVAWLNNKGESVKMTNKQISALAGSANGDIRYMLNQFEFWRRSPSADCSKELPEMGYFSLLDYLFKPSKKTTEANKQAADHDMLQMAVYQNYPAVAGDDLDRMADLSDDISMWDAAVGYSTPEWMGAYILGKCHQKTNDRGKYTYPDNKLFRMSQATKECGSYLDIVAHSNIVELVVTQREAGVPDGERVIPTMRSHMETREMLMTYELESDHPALSEAFIRFNPKYDETESRQIRANIGTLTS